MREFIQTPLKVEWWRRTEAQVGGSADEGVGGSQWCRWRSWASKTPTLWRLRKLEAGGWIQRRFEEEEEKQEELLRDRSLTCRPFITYGWRNNLAASGVTTGVHKLPLIEPNLLQVCESSAPANQEKLAQPLLSCPDHLWKHTSVEKNTQRRPQQNPIRWHGLGSSNITLLFFY